jgi:hypothetical protein
MEYKHIGWCREGKHDKVWGIICLAHHPASHDTLHPFPNYRPERNDYLTFWGRRGTKLHTKLWNGQDWDAKEMFLKKQKNGYDSVGIDELNEVYPEFQQDLEKTALWATLKL